MANLRLLHGSSWSKCLTSTIRHAVLLSLCALPAGVFLAGCGGGGSVSPDNRQNITVSLSPSSAPNLEQGSTLAITSSVAVTWSVSPGGGSLTNVTSTSVTYNAPASVSIATTAMITATSTADPSKSASLKINLAPPPMISSANLPAGTVGAAYTASISGAGGVPPFTWSLASGAFPAGIGLGSSTGRGITLAGTPTAPGTATFTVKATDANGFSVQSQSLSIVINAAVTPVSITTASPLPNGTVASPYSQTLAATGGVPPYTWSLASGSSLPAKLALNSMGTVSGTPLTAGNAAFTVSVSDSDMPVPQSITKQFSVTIDPTASACSNSPTGHEAMLKGQYTFVLNALQGSGTGSAVALAGSFAPDGAGNVLGPPNVGGEMDIDTQAGGLQHFSIVPSSSIYTVGPDATGSGDLGCVQLLLSDGTLKTFHFSLGGLSSGVYMRGRIIEFDDATGTGTRGSGILRLQTPSAFALNQLAASYAFGLDGADPDGNHVAVGGSFSLDNATGNITNGFSDVSAGGALLSPLSGGSGNIESISAISALTGRAAGTFSIGTAAEADTYTLITYVVSPSEILVVAGLETLAENTILSGRMIVTGAPGSFSQSALSGNYILHSTGGSSVTLSLVTASAGSFSGTAFSYDGTTAASTPISGATYAVDAVSGRAAIMNAGSTVAIFYLSTVTDGISAFVVGNDAPASFGYAEASTGSFTTASLAGKYFFGTEDPTTNTVTDRVGVVTLAANGSITGTRDQSASTAPTLQAGLAITGETVLITNANGIGNVGPNSVAITNGTKLFFIDENTGAPAIIAVVEK